jgi:hypothetical protein
MASLILDILGFHINRDTLIPPNIQNEQEVKKMNLCIKQIELVEWFITRKGKKESLCEC